MSITESAFWRSALANSDVLWNLGLFSKQAGNLFFVPAEWGTYEERRLFTIEPRKILQLLRGGAHLEDDGKRALNHFYDPYNDEALFGTIRGWKVYAGRKNPEWALGTPWTGGYGDVASPQSMSLAQSTDYLYEALTSKFELERRFAYGKLFASLGHVVHLLQDMAQPEHTRLDIHCNIMACKALDKIAEETVYDPSHYEFLIGNDGYEEYNQVDYPVVELGKYRDYFDNPDGSGLADFSNRSFVSKDTNFIGSFDVLTTNPRYPQPSPAAAKISTPGVVYTSTIDGTTWTVYQKEIRAEYIDYYKNNGPQTDHLTATASLFEPDTPDVDPSQYPKVSAIIGITDASYRHAAELLLPRAEGYTAGFLNHFFRGRMGARISERGYYAAADHTDGEGFRQIRVQLRNETPDVNPLNGPSISQDMGYGEVVAVASFRENGCYQQELKGDLHADENGYAYFPGNCDFGNWEGGEEIRILSAPIPVASLSTEWTEMVFDFSAQPIPFSALDLEVSFIFRGELGQGSDEIAVVRHDISEPTYIGFSNSTDLHWLFGEWIDGFSLRDNDETWDDDRVAQFIDTEYWLDGFKLAYGPLPPQRYQRIAVLLDPGVARNVQFSYRFEFYKDPFGDDTVELYWTINPIINATQERESVIGYFFGFPIKRYYKDWCGDDGSCTLSGLSEMRGISQWANVDEWFFLNPYPTDEELEQRAHMDITNASGTIVID